ncbi:transposase [Ectothiorhodospira magna]|uniref:transposase n=1 Tax=Ectothiorhodospira magna TaxID=867345 RepID=UPI00192E5419
MPGPPGIGLVLVAVYHGPGGGRCCHCHCHRHLFWHRAYYAGSVGGASLETVQAYMESQGTKPLKRNPA